jgi:hypothetical protein
VFWEIVSVDQQGTPIIQRRKASNKRPGSKSKPRVPGVSRSVRALRYAYMSIGFSAAGAMLVLLCSLVGSYFNIPVAQLPERHILSGHHVTFFGMRYVVPVVIDWPGTVVAVNVGGALIPGLTSLYLFIRHRLWVRGLLAIACTSSRSKRATRQKLNAHKCAMSARHDQNALKFLRGHPIDRLVNLEDLSDEQCYAIWLAWDAEWRPEGYVYPISRDMAAYYVRGFLNPSTTSIDWLEYLERQLTAAEEHELARWMRRLRQERQALN